MYDLVVALLKLSVNVNVLDVKHSQVLKHLILGPFEKNRLACLI